MPEALADILRSPLAPAHAAPARGAQPDLAAPRANPTVSLGNQALQAAAASCPAFSACPTGGACHSCPFKGGA